MQIHVLVYKNSEGEIEYCTATPEQVKAWREVDPVADDDETKLSQWKPNPSVAFDVAARNVLDLAEHYETHTPKNGDGGGGGGTMIKG